jgi:hypothetical protein
VKDDERASDERIAYQKASGRGNYRNDLLHAKLLLLDDLRISSCLLRPVTQTRDERSYVSTSSLLSHCAQARGHKGRPT